MDHLKADGVEVSNFHFFEDVEKVGGDGLELVVELRVFVEAQNQVGRPVVVNARQVQRRTIITVARN